MKTLEHIVNENLKFKINRDTAKLHVSDLEAVDMLYRLDIFLSGIYVDIHTVKEIRQNKENLYIPDNSTHSVVYDGGNIQGEYQFAKDDEYIYSFWNRDEKLRILFLPSQKDIFYNVFDFLYNQDDINSIALVDLRDTIPVPTIANMLKKWSYNNLHLRTPKSILDNIYNFEKTDR